MDLISQLFFAVVISSVAGSLLLFVWKLLRSFFMLADPRLINITLRIVCIIYMLPLGYTVILLLENKWLEGREQGWKLFFARTEWLNTLIQLMAIVWFLIACGVTFMRIMQNVVWCRKLEDNIPMDEEPEADVFSRICQKMGIPKDAVSLQRNPLMMSPVIVKARHPQIILPEQEYTEGELELIFYHELSHYKHHDLKWKVAVVILTAIQGFNPVIYRLLSIVSLWSECMADVTALESSGNIHNARQYFEKIEKLLPAIEEQKKDKYLFASLYRDNKTMVKRVEFVRYYQHAHILSRQTAVATLAGFVFVSILLSAVTGMLITELHKLIYKFTSDYIVMQEDGVAEYYEDGKEWKFDEQAIVLMSANEHMEEQSTYHIECTIKPCVFKTICNISAKDGQTIGIGLTGSFCTADYFIGIQDKDGYICYVKGNGCISHNFQVTKTGKYSVFVQNNSTDKAMYDTVFNVALDNLQ